MTRGDQASVSKARSFIFNRGFYPDVIKVTKAEIVIVKSASEKPLYTVREAHTLQMVYALSVACEGYAFNVSCKADA